MFGRKLFCLLPFLLLSLKAMAATGVLTLSQAEQLALSNAKELIILRAEQQTQVRHAVVNEHLEAPSFQVGADYPKDVLPSLPLDKTTAYMVGVKQPLPELRTQKLQSLATSYLTKAKTQRIAQVKAQILREVRESWLNLFEVIQTQSILVEQLAVMEKSPAAKTPENQQKTAKLQFQLAQARQQEKVLRIQLNECIGKVAFVAPLPTTLPDWPPLPDKKILEQQVVRSPQLLADSHLIRASQQSLKISTEHHDSGLNLNLGYGFEENTNAENNFAVNNKPNILTFGVTFKLGDNPPSPEDSAVNQKVARLQAHYQQQRQDFLVVTKSLTQAYENWKSYDKKAALCASDAATPKSMTPLDCLHAQVNRAKAQVQIFYLLGK